MKFHWQVQNYTASGAPRLYWALHGLIGGFHPFEKNVHTFISGLLSTDLWRLPTAILDYERFYVRS